jgi:ketosteroid isomerase-like protein
MTDDANLQLIRDAFSAGNRAAETGWLEDWLSIFSEDIVWEAVEDAPDAGTYRGHQGIRGYLQDWLDTVDGFRGELRELTAVGDCVVADTRINARIKGTDSEMTFDYSQVSLIEDGKITHIKEFREHDDAFAYAQASERGGS